MTTAENLVLATQRARESAQAVGAALASVAVYAEPAITRAVQAEQNLYARIEQEFGMLTSTEAGKRMGSRSRAPRNFAATAHRDNTLVAVRQGNSLSYPGFQFGPDGQPLEVIARLREIANANEWHMCSSATGALARSLKTRRTRVSSPVPPIRRG